MYDDLVDIIEEQDDTICMLLEQVSERDKLIGELIPICDKNLLESILGSYNHNLI